MKSNKARNILKPLYYRVDQEIGSMAKVCTKGCFFCCYQPIEIFSIEKATLGEFIQKELNNETKQAIKENTLKWLDYFDENTPSREPLSSKDAFGDFRFKAENIPIPCPLLINGECSVYKARPLNCRTHIVNDDKKLCEQDKLRNGTPASMDIRNEAVAKLKAEGAIEIIPLTYALVEILKIDRKTKKIEKTLLK